MRYQQHVLNWRSCTECPLHETRNRVVLCRGSLPCDILFVGEAPGESENSVGKPFVGPAGNLLDQIIERSLGRMKLCAECHAGWLLSLLYESEGIESHCTRGHVGTSGTSIRYALTNIVACIPRDEDGVKVGQPEDDCIEACQPRFMELYEMAKPKMVVTVGKMARDWLEPGMKKSVPIPRNIPRVHIPHPASILRISIANRGLEVQRCVATLTQAIEELCDA